MGGRALRTGRPIDVHRVSPVTRVAAVDCGTNSLRLLVADVDPVAGTLVDVERRTEIVRLGEGVDATGTIHPRAMVRALAVTGEYARIIEQAGARRVRFVGTSASRDAANAAEFAAGVRALVGVEPEVVTGQEEAQLSFAGASRGLPGSHPAPYLVVDLGGGSTEFVLGSEDAEAAVSVDVGSVRLTERHLSADPPTPAQVGAARQDVAAALAAVARSVDLTRTATLVGVAGTVTTITAHALGLPAYEPARVHGGTLSVGEARRACQDLLTMPREARARLPYLHPGRIDVIGAGALIWDLVLAEVAAVTGITEVVTSEHDILDGIAWSLAPGRPTPGLGPGTPRYVR